MIHLSHSNLEDEAFESEQNAKKTEPSDSQEHHLSVDEPVTEQDGPVVSMNTQTDVDNKENSNGPSTEHPSVDRYTNDLIYSSFIWVTLVVHTSPFTFGF